jgi:hypothetical protein
MTGSPELEMFETFDCIREGRRDDDIVYVSILGDSKLAPVITEVSQNRNGSADSAEFAVVQNRRDFSLGLSRSVESCPCNP